MHTYKRVEKHIEQSYEHFSATYSSNLIWKKKLSCSFCVCVDMEVLFHDNIAYMLSWLKAMRYLFYDSAFSYSLFRCCCCCNSYCIFNFFLSLYMWIIFYWQPAKRTDWELFSCNRHCVYFQYDGVFFNFV